MAEEVAHGCVVFVFDENVSRRMANMLTHCGAKTVPQIQVETIIERRMNVKHDPDWISKCAEKQWIVVTTDCAMIEAHDIARVAQNTGAIVLMLRPEISQQKRWGLMQWHLTNLQKIARHVKRVQQGSAFRVGVDGELHCIKPSKPKGT